MLPTTYEDEHTHLWHVVSTYYVLYSMSLAEFCVATGQKFFPTIAPGNSTS
jgi:hypothetical protein